MDQNKVEDLKNSLRKIAQRRMEQITELSELQKEITGNTINWDGLKRQQKMDQEMELAEIENKAEIDRLVNNFNKKLESESAKAGIEYINKASALLETRELARLLEISLSDMNSILYDMARISEPALLINETDTFSKLVLRKQLVLGMLSGDIKERVIRKNRVVKDELIILKQLQTGRDFIIGQVAKRTPDELKQISLEQLLENDMPK